MCSQYSNRIIDVGVTSFSLIVSHSRLFHAALIELELTIAGRIGFVTEETDFHCEYIDGNLPSQPRVPSPMNRPWTDLRT